VIFGGEALDLKSLKPWFERHGDTRPRLINMYGITETTVHVTYRPLSASDLDAGSVIGVPIPDLQIHLLDSAGNRVPAGEPGEIYVGGAGLARGYLNRPELTAQRFIADPAQPGQRLYRSGDLGRYLANGDLEYLGRIDSQVKIRGFRIELGEISAELNVHPAIRESVVIVTEAVPGDKALAAYLVRRPGADVDVTALRLLLRRRLPEYMVPATFTFMDRLPLTVNGKLDLRALPAPVMPTANAAAADFSQGTALERGIAGIWRDVLHIPEPGLDENFFDVGGNSLHIAAVHARLQTLLSREFSITELFAHSTIRALAAHFSPTAKIDGASDAQLRAQRQRNVMSAQRHSRRQQK
jgi:hypothetical protein